MIQYFYLYEYRFLCVTTNKFVTLSIIIQRTRYGCIVTCDAGSYIIAYIYGQYAYNRYNVSNVP